MEVSRSHVRWAARAVHRAVRRGRRCRGRRERHGYDDELMLQPYKKAVGLARSDRDTGLWRFAHIKISGFARDIWVCKQSVS